MCEVINLHDPETCHQLFQDTLWRFRAPIQRLRNYYGEHVTLYFAWLSFFTGWLWVPGIAGVLLWLLQPSDMTVDRSPWAPIFSLLIVVWGVLFLRFWQRENAAWVHKWGTIDFARREVVLPEHRGILRISPVRRSWREGIWCRTVPLADIVC